MPRFRVLAAVLSLVAILQGALIVRARSLQAAHARDISAGSAIARVLGLSDLAIWTEARYTRHPSLADRATAFQDHPGSLEHFPAGSVVMPPRHLLPAGAATATAR